MNLNWVLDENGEPKPEPDMLKWGMWFEMDERRIVRQQRWVGEDGLERFVSTVFLGLDHGWRGPPPVLWETMAWVGDGDTEYQRRYTSREDAIAGHQELVVELGGTPLG